MPYYCTVPRCTSMAGKAKNVSFHQFPRDVELARLWNEILKRGKPYTKYSKVCSLHFRPEDYIITSMGKNKGQWRTLRKDAIPSRNLPSETPALSHRTRASGAWLPDEPTNADVPRICQQIAHAIYLQTMLAMQAAVNGSQTPPVANADTPNATFPENSLSLAEVEEIIKSRTQKQSPEVHPGHNGAQETSRNGLNHERTSYKCEECSKCFKDPDVFILHKRIHNRNQRQDSNSVTSSSEKENLDANTDFSKQDPLKANPILANLLKSTPNTNQGEAANVFDMDTVLSVENQIMQALAANMESHIRNLSSVTPDAEMGDENDQTADDDDDDKMNDQNSNQSSAKLNSTIGNVDGNEDFSSNNVRNSIEDNQLEANDDCIEYESNLAETENSLALDVKESQADEPHCDSEDLDISKDSNSLVIDETA